MLLPKVRTSPKCKVSSRSIVPSVLRLALVAASRVTQSNFLAVIRSYPLPSDAGLTSYLKRSFDSCRLVHLVVDQQKKKKNHNNTFNRASINRVAAIAAAVAAAVVVTIRIAHVRFNIDFGGKFS